MNSKFNHARIKAISTVIPQKEINIYDEVEYYGNSVKKVDRMRKMVGFYKRRIVDDTTTAADLAYDAAKKLFEKTKIDKNSIDALVFVVQQPDVMAPSTAYFIHDKLGLSKDCIATDINQGCVGWVYGLYMVSQMIESGTHKRVLLLNADTPSICINPSDRNSAPIFGDAGTATLIEYSEEEIDSYYSIETISSGFEAIVGPFTGKRFRKELSNDADWEMMDKLRKERITMPTGNEVPLLGGYLDGLSVFDFTMRVVPKNINDVLEFSNVNKDEVGALCLHQANKQIVQSVANASGFDGTDEVHVPYKAFENYGNNTMCSIPTTLAILDKNIKRDKVLCCSFGNGLVSIASVLNLKDTQIFDLDDFEKPSYVKTRDEYIDYWRKKIKGEI